MTDAKETNHIIPTTSYIKFKKPHPQHRSCIFIACSKIGVYTPSDLPKSPICVLMF